jgi:hypothetical protein
MFLALLFTALGEVAVGVEVLRVPDPEYVRLGWLIRSPHFLGRSSAPRS